MIVDGNFLNDLNFEILNITKKSLDYARKEYDTYIIKRSFDNLHLLVSFLRIRFEVEVEEVEETDKYRIEMFYDDYTLKQLINLYKKFKNTTNEIESTEIEIKQYVNDIYYYWDHINNFAIRLRIHYGLGELFESLKKYLNEIPENYNNPNESIWGIQSGYKCFYCMSNDHYLNYAWKCDKTEDFCECRCLNGNCRHTPVYDSKAKKLYFDIDGYQIICGNILYTENYWLKEFVIKYKIVLYELEDYLKKIYFISKEIKNNN